MPISRVNTAKLVLMFLLVGCSKDSQDRHAYIDVSSVEKEKVGNNLLWTFSIIGVENQILVPELVLITGGKVRALPSFDEIPLSGNPARGQILLLYVPGDVFGAHEKASITISWVSSGLSSHQSHVIEKLPVLGIQPSPQVKIPQGRKEVLLALTFNSGGKTHFPVIGTVDEAKQHSSKTGQVVLLLSVSWRAERGSP